MVKPVAGEIVVIAFPRNDPAAGKRRPALVIADLPGEDLILCQITSRALCRKAASTSSSLSLSLAAKARVLIRQRSRSGLSSMSFSIALTGFGFADRRKALRRVLVSLESFMSQSG